MISTPSSSMAIPKLGFFLISLALFCLSSGRAQNPARTVQRALLCFNNKLTQIYSGCDEEYRLDESGDINVPPLATDQFCSGPCLAETQKLLGCINDIFSGFRFGNKATVRAVSDAIQAGCSFTRQRGIFDVEEYTSPAPSTSISISLLYGCTVFGLYLLFL